MEDSFLGATARGVVRALVRFYYPRLEVTGGERIPRTGPVLLVANHPNSLLDPVLLGVAARRPVRLMAKAPLFDVPVFGPVMHALGMVPAYRGSDNPREVAKNLDSLAAAARSLAAGHVLGIFPEGKSHDAAQLAQVRSGAARLAMQALEMGATGLHVVPVGLNYERKERFRSAVWIDVGEPVDVTAWLAAHEGDSHKAMRTLTTEIASRLRAVITHLDDTAWEPLLDELEALLPAAGFKRRHALEAVHLRKRAADAINALHVRDRPRAEAAATRVREHFAARHELGLPDYARVLEQHGLRLTGALLWDGLALTVGSVAGVLGLLHHLVPYGIVRILAGRLSPPGRMTVALYRLLFSVPIYALWYVAVWWGMRSYFLPWVATAWTVSMMFGGLAALRVSRRLRTALPRWWAQTRLALRPARLRELRVEHDGITQMLREIAVEVAPERYAAEQEAPRSVFYRPPWWINTLAALVVVGALAGVAWLWRDRPVEWRDYGEAPNVAALAPAELDAELTAQERALTAVAGGLHDLEDKFQVLQGEILAGQKSFYRPADDDEIRRDLTQFLAYRTALLRTAWHWQRYEEITDEHLRLRALLLHYTAVALSYDYAVRFVRAFRDAPDARRKLNEAEPRWDLPPDTYDRMRAYLANTSHRAWLKAGWEHYLATVPAWQAAGLTEAEPWASFHKEIRRAATDTAGLGGEILTYKIETAAADVKRLAGGGYYRVSAAVDTVVGDTKIRQPRDGAALISPADVARLHPMLQPGDIVLERRNWFLSNAFLPGYWPHSALYVGTADDLRALGLDKDPRVQAHLAEFSTPDAAGHAYAFIEAMSEGVVFTSIEHSIGGADSVAVLRPRVPDDARREIIARAFDNAGKPYDFDFDFFSADKLVCTEVVYRSCSGYVDFPLVEVLGRHTLPAVEMVRYWNTAEGAQKLQFIAFLDGDEQAGRVNWHDADELRTTINRPALTWLQP